MAWCKGTCPRLLVPALCVAVAALCSVGVGCGSGGGDPTEMTLVYLRNARRLDPDGVPDGGCSDGTVDNTLPINTVYVEEYFSNLRVATWSVGIVPGEFTVMPLPPGTYVFRALFDDGNPEHDQCAIDDPVIVSGSSIDVTFQR
jgi:hypothetical protein